MTTLYENLHLINPGVELPHSGLLVADGRIAAILPAGTPRPRADRTIDLAGRSVMPGFVDIHFHGCLGADFCDGTLDSLNRIGRGKAAEGVTTMVPATLTIAEGELFRALETAREYRRHPTGARLAGVHLEGPFLAPTCLGAQNPAYRRDFDPDFVERADRIVPILKVTFAPELPGGIAFTRFLADRGIMPSGGHSAADYACFEEARQAGMKHLTHFCNVMTPLHHLRFGMVGGGLTADDVYVEIIADGIHLTAEMIRFIFRNKGVRRVMLITDAMCAAGMPDGRYALGGLPVEISNGRATLTDGVTVAGSTLRFHRGVRFLRETTGLPLAELAYVTGFNQARSLGITGAGELSPGNPADFVVLDDQLEVVETWIDGELAATPD